MTESGTDQELVPATVDEVAAAGDDIMDAIGLAVVGQREPIRLALAAMLAGGHVLIEDVPGLGKTIARRCQEVRRYRQCSREAGGCLADSRQSRLGFVVGAGSRASLSRSLFSRAKVVSLVGLRQRHDVGSGQPLG